MNGTILFVNQYIRKEDSKLSDSELVNKYKLTNDCRYIAQLFNNVLNTINWVSNIFPSMDKELKYDIALYKVYETINIYDESKGNFNTLFSNIFRKELCVNLIKSNSQKNKANINTYNNINDEEETDLINELTFIDNSYEDIIYKESILKSNKLSEKEKKLCMFIIDNNGNVNEQLEFLNTTRPTLIKIKNNIKKFL